MQRTDDRGRGLQRRHMKRVLTLAVATLASAGLAEARPRDVLHFQRPAARPVSATADSHIIFMNNCLPNGCLVKTGDTDSRVDTSDIAVSTGTLSAWSYGQTTWDATMSCMRATFSRFNVVITDVDPGTTPHYEVMVAGSAQQIMGNQGAGVGGVADFPCQDVGELRSVHAQRARLRVRRRSSVPMPPRSAPSPRRRSRTPGRSITSSMRPTRSPITSTTACTSTTTARSAAATARAACRRSALTCTGSGGQATHMCSGNNAATQDEVATMLALFGPSAPATPPTVSITSPADGATRTSAASPVAATVSRCARRREGRAAHRRHARRRRLDRAVQLDRRRPSSRSAATPSMSPATTTAA